MSLFDTSVVLLVLGFMGSAQTVPPQKLPDGTGCQNYPGDASANSGSVPCTTCGTASQRFPYPAEAAPAPGIRGPKPTPDTPPASQANPCTAASGANAPNDRGETELVKQQPSPAKQFPYPGETAAPGLDAGVGESSSSSSASGRSPGDTYEPGSAAPNASRRRRLPKPERLQSDEDREAEDLTVANFYRQAGNLNAAYLRSKDAVKMQPDDPEAHFALADIAQKLGKNGEALTEYSTYLKLDPDGSRVRSAHKALSALK